MDHIKTTYQSNEARNAFVLEDVHDAYLTQLNIQQGEQAAPYFDLRNVSDFSIKDARNIKDRHVKKITQALLI